MLLICFLASADGVHTARLDTYLGRTRRYPVVSPSLLSFHHHNHHHHHHQAPHLPFPRPPRLEVSISSPHAESPKHILAASPKHSLHRGPAKKSPTSLFFAGANQAPVVQSPYELRVLHGTSRPLANATQRYFWDTRNRQLLARRAISGRVFSI